MSQLPIVHIDRFACCPWGVFGAIRIEGAPFEAYTVERPWLDNKRSVSCIPAGQYMMKLDVYYGGDGVGGREDYPAYELEAVPNRKEIKIHILNAPTQSEGCIGLGDSPGWYKEQWALMNASATYKRFMAAMGGAKRSLLIIRWKVQP